ncbi:MAG: hypothetical protein AAF633_24965 [Chloroflexota bacterium]
MNNDGSSKHALFKLLRRYYSMNELELLAFECGVEWDELSGENKSLKAKSLIKFLGRREKLQELVDLAKEQRPKVKWPKIPAPELQHDLIEHHINSQAELEFRQTGFKWILVAGLGRANLLPDYPQVFYASTQIGKLIAQKGWGLLAGGWSGVDYIVAKEFSSELAIDEDQLKERLLQVRPEGEQPEFSRGTVVWTKPGQLEWLNIVKRSHAVILIGGEGGTGETYTYALREGKPVFPLAGTKGDAKKIFREMLDIEMLEKWDYSPLNRISPIKFAQILNQNIDSEMDAIKVVSDVVNLISETI